MNFRRLAKKVCGVDPDAVVLKNPFFDEAKIGKGECLPYDDEKFDIVYTDNVFEHLEDPQKVFLEVHRVLKENGCFISKTPNIYHYVPLLARITPHWLHVLYANLLGRKEEDTYPTFYRANSRKKIMRLAKRTGFKIEQIILVEGRPEYLRFFPLAYLGGFVYERLVNKFNWLESFKIVICVVLRKI